MTVTFLLNRNALVVLVTPDIAPTGANSSPFLRLKKAFNNELLPVLTRPTMAMLIVLSKFFPAASNCSFNLSSTSFSSIVCIIVYSQSKFKKILMNNQS